MSGMRARVVRTVAVAAALAGAVAVATIPAEAAGVHYVALGDSYSAGTGAGNYGSSGACTRSANAYPQLWANQHAPESFAFPACAWATTKDVLEKQVGTLSATTTLVTITIGGNDVDFAGVMATCSTGGDQACLDKIASSTAKAEAVLPGDLDRTYRAIAERAPSARVIVLGYPRIFASGPAFCTISLTKRTALNKAADRLNAIIADRAAAAGFAFSAVADEFAGHGVCSGAPWLHGLRWYPLVESYHPTKAGQSSGYYPALTSVTG